MAATILTILGWVTILALMAMPCWLLSSFFWEGRMPDYRLDRLKPDDFLYELLLDSENLERQSVQGGWDQEQERYWVNTLELIFKTLPDTWIRIRRKPETTFYRLTIFKNVPILGGSLGGMIAYEPKELAEYGCYEGEKLHQILNQLFFHHQHLINNRS
jgi:hypothetical protein